ncbi:MAG TPA: hypothetical protein PLE83_04750 [Myxococcota bacterium]|nr:hypothetical protein [Myxococcota bacterium]HRR73967.1 hypothetical protein [Myxococcota bacterium]
MRIWRFLILALLVAFAGCTKAGKVATPELYLEAYGDISGKDGRVNNGDTVYFLNKRGAIRIIIGNAGDLEMNLYEPQVTSTNPQMKENLGFTTWPKVIPAGDVGPNSPGHFKFVINFNPDGSQDDTPMTIEIETDDFLHLPQGKFVFHLAPEKAKPELKVTPASHTYLDATITQPSTQTFELTNVGNAKLILGGARIDPADGAFKIGGDPLRTGTILEPVSKGLGNNLVKIDVKYSPIEPPEEADLVVLWGAEVETGVSCSSPDVCSKNEDLCPNGAADCPYTCIESKCACLSDLQCKTAFCQDPNNCNIMCLSGVCRAPEEKRVSLKGESEPGQLKVDYADILVGCLDFTEVTVEGQSCTKIVQLWNESDGAVKVFKPKAEVAEMPEGLPSPYTVRWFQRNASQDEVPCGEVTGTEILQEQQTIVTGNQPINVAVTYRAPSTRGVNGELVIDYAAPFPGKASVQLCGGIKKGEIGVAPNPTIETIVLFAKPDEKAQKTVVVMNKGNDVLDLTGITIGVEEGYPKKFSLKNEPTAGQLKIQPGQMLPLTVEYDGTHDLGIITGSLEINYQDPTNAGNTMSIIVPIRGQNSFEGVDLPVADPGKTSDYAGAKVGQNLILDGSNSVDGTFLIVDNGGYSWFVSAKPAASKLFFYPGPGGAMVNVIPDVAGEYEFRLVVFSYDAQNNMPYYSHEGVVKINVQP